MVEGLNDQIHKLVNKSIVLLCFGHKFPTNRFVGNFLQSTYKNDTCPLSM
jgi:hypothetical protein